MIKANIKTTLVLTLLTVFVLAGAFNNGFTLCKHQAKKRCHSVEKAHCKVSAKVQSAQTSISQESCMTYVEHSPISPTLKNEAISFLANSDMLPSDITYEQPVDSVKITFLSFFNSPVQGKPFYLLNRQFIL